MFERFTDRARRAVVLAEEEARQLDHPTLGTEHLLLGILHEGTGPAADALDALGVSLDSTRTQVLRLLGRGDRVPTGHLPFTPRARTVSELAMRAAISLRHEQIGTEHLLLGLLDEGTGMACQALTNASVDHTELRRQLMSQMSSGLELPPDPWASPTTASHTTADVATTAGPPASNAATSGSYSTQPASRAGLWREVSAACDELDRLDAEVRRLRDLLRQHGIDPDSAPQAHRDGPG